MQRILIVSPSPSHPAIQGNRKRIQEIGHIFLNLGYDVHFLWLAEEWRGIISASALEDMKAFWSSLFVVPPQGFSQPQITQLSNVTKAYIEWLQTNYEYEVVWVHYAWYSAICAEFEFFETVRVIDTHDCLADRDCLMKSEHIDHANFYSLSQGQEATALKQADLVIACQPQDEAFFTDTYALNTVRTIGQPMPELSINKFYKKDCFSSFCAGFIGSNNAVNKESLHRLLEVFSIYKGILPSGFKLVLAGKMTDGFDFSAYGLDDFLQVLGAVDRVEDFYESLDIVLVPLSFGTGLKVKAVEAMASCLPVLATRHATIGLQVSEPEHSYASEKALVTGLLSIVQAQPKEQEEILQRLQASSLGIIDQYRSFTMAQVASVMKEIDAIAKRKKQSTMLTKDNLDALKEIDGPLYIYGAGLGGEIVWTGLSPEVQVRVQAFLDQEPIQAELFSKPILKPDVLGQENKSSASVIIALMTAQGEKVRYLLEQQGYKEVYSARRYIRHKMLHVHS